MNFRGQIRARICKLQKGCTRLAAASDKAYQLLAHGRWFPPGTPLVYEHELLFIFFLHMYMYATKIDESTVYMEPSNSS
jgi:hypothetical protein